MDLKTGIPRMPWEIIEQLCSDVDGEPGLEMRAWGPVGTHRSSKAAAISSVETS